MKELKGHIFTRNESGSAPNAAASGCRSPLQAACTEMGERASGLRRKSCDVKRGTDCSVPARMLFFPLTDAAVDRVVCPLF